MKKRLLLMLLFLVVLSEKSVVKADMIIFPPNAFFSEHKAECVQVMNTYEAVRDTYYYDKPNGFQDYFIEAGRQVYIEYLWHDTWGYETWLKKWVKLSDFKRIYDERYFMETHGAELYDVTGEIHFGEDEITYKWDFSSGSIDPSVAEAAKALVSGTYPVNFWTFPGSGELFDSKSKPGGSERLTFGPIYMDPEGRLWGRIDDYYEIRWICLSLPSDDTLPRTVPHYAEEALDDSPVEQKRLGAAGITNDSDPDGPSYGVVAAAVIIVMLITGLLLYRLQKTSVNHAHKSLEPR